MITVSKEDCDKQRGLTIIRKLMMLDHRAPTELSSFSIPMPENLGFGADSASLEKKLMMFSQVAEDSSQNLHPMDIINAIYNCCDQVLLQILTGKMFKCRLAIPLLLPDIRKHNSTFQLWSLRNIVPEWKSNGEKVNQLSLVDIEHPLISFVRIGNLKRSKSQLINKLLSSSNHDTFFHRDCKNGTIERVDSNGTIEMSCFFPTEVNIKLKKMFSVLNLRGNALEFMNESTFLYNNSSLIIILMSLNSAQSKSYLNFKCWNLDSVRSKTRVILSFVCDSIGEVPTHSESILECVNFLKAHNIDVIDVVFDWRKLDLLFSFEEWKSKVENAIHNCIEKLILSSLTNIANTAEKSGFVINEDDLWMYEQYRKL